MRHTVEVPCPDARLPGGNRGHRHLSSWKCALNFGSRGRSVCQHLRDSPFTEAAQYKLRMPLLANVHRTDAFLSIFALPDGWSNANVGILSFGSCGQPRSALMTPTKSTTKLCHVVAFRRRACSWRCCCCTRRKCIHQRYTQKEHIKFKPKVR